jgi:hypothetical protein
MMRIPAFVLLCACAEPAVEMRLVLPANGDVFDTSCLTSIEVYVNGRNYLEDDDDDRSSCRDLDGDVSSYQAIVETIRGKFEVPIPDSGLLGIEVYGYSTGCNVDGGDVLFVGRGDYNGHDRIDIPLMPNVSCARNEVKIRSFDMFALIGGATCDAAGTYQDGVSASVGTIFPWPYERGTTFASTVLRAPATGNLATLTGMTKTGPVSCLAIDAGTEDDHSTSCAVGGAAVCAAAGEIEHATLPSLVVDNLQNYDAMIMAQFPNIILGSVWSSGATKAPIAGATIDVDPEHGKVVYVDVPTANGLLPVRTARSTGASGLFTIYADAVLNAKVTANGQTRTVRIAGSDEGLAAAMIVIGP